MNPNISRPLSISQRENRRAAAINEEKIQSPDFGWDRTRSDSLKFRGARADTPICRKRRQDVRTTWTVATVRGIELRIHATFWLVVACFGVAATRIGLHGAALAEAYLLLAVACLAAVAHELGHVVAAAAFGLRTEAVTLLPIGASARLDRRPDTPQAEMAIAAAGPFVSIVLAAAFLIAGYLAQGGRVLLRLDAIPYAGFWVKMFWTNVLIAALNMTPALPMDGGQLLRGALRAAAGAKAATYGTCGLGVIVALAALAGGIVLDPFLLVVGALALAGAHREWRRWVAESFLREPTVDGAVVRKFYAVAPEQPLLPLLDALDPGERRDVPVVEGGIVVGVLTREAFARGLAGGRHAVTVGEVMLRDVEPVWADEPLRAAIDRMRRLDLRLVPVRARGGGVVGVLELDAAVARLVEQEAQNAAVLAPWDESA
jgi:stage IV sporulation protein FB